MMMISPARTVGEHMEVRLKENGPVVKSVAEVLQRAQRQLQAEQNSWLQQLREHPEQFADLEVHIHQTFQQLADQVVAGVLAEATAPADFAQDAKKK
jgi:hypothetical protein